MHSIIKLCADHLRTFSNTHNVKLKSGHAHELVAAFFGYKSKAAMLADKLNPEANFSQLQILVLMPSSFIAERQKSLEGLSPDLPDVYSLGEEMFVKLISEEKLSFRVFPSWKYLAEALTTEYLQMHGDVILPLNFRPYENAYRIFSKPLYKFNPKVEATDGEIKLTVANRYYGSPNVHFQSIDVTVLIKIQRIAGHVGFLKPDISVLDVFNQSNEAEASDES